MGRVCSCLLNSFSLWQGTTGFPGAAGRVGSPGPNVSVLSTTNSLKGNELTESIYNDMCTHWNSLSFHHRVTPALLALLALQVKTDQRVLVVMLAPQEDMETLGFVDQLEHKERRESLETVDHPWVWFCTSQEPTSWIHALRQHPVSFTCYFRLQFTDILNDNCTLLTCENCHVCTLQIWYS